MKQLYINIIATLVFGLLTNLNTVNAQCPIPASAVAFTASTNNVCAQTNITFTVTNPDPNYDYTWDFDDAASGSNNTATGTVVTHSFSANNAGGSHNVKVTATPKSNTTQNVTWGSVSGSDIVTFGNSMVKTSGGSYNRGGESTQSVTDDMFVEFIAGLTSNRLTCGMSDNPGNHNRSQIDFGIETRHDGTIRVYERNAHRGNFGSYSYGDTLRVSAESGTIRYYHNGNLIYTSSLTPSFPMVADGVIRNSGDTLHNVTVGLTCSASDSMTITILATPDIQVTGTWDRCIAVDNLGFTNTIFQIDNHIAGQSYDWNFGDGTTISSTLPTITHQYTTHGVYDVTVSYSNGTCTGSYTNQVRYLERPLANMVVVGQADICEGDTIYIANNTDTTNVLYYVMDWGDGTRDTVYNTDTLFHIYTFTDVFACTISQGGQPYDLTLYAVNACFEHTNSSPITVTATPRLDFSAPSITCEQTNALNGVSFSNATCPPAPDIFSDLNNYIWDFGDPASGGTNTSTLSNPTHIFSNPGEFLVTVQVIGNCGTYYDTMNVRILDDPDANFGFNVNNPPANTINGDGCTPIEAYFQNNTTGDSVTYSWTIQTDVIGGTNFINGTSDTSTNPQMEFLLPGDYIVTLTATNPCTSTTAVDTITVLDGPSVTLNPASPTCDTFLYTPSVNYDEGGGAIDSFFWSFPGAVPDTSNLQFPTNILYNSPGTYQVIVRIKNECTVASDTIQFYIPFTPSPVTLSANGNQNTCIDAAAFNLSADSTGGTWSGTGITDAVNGTFNPAVAGLGTHTITYTYQPRACPAVVTIDITVNDLPTVGAGADEQLCINDGILTLSGQSPVGGTWSGVGIVDGNLGTFDPTMSGAGVFPITYTYTDGNGCENSDVKNVRVFDLPALNLGGDRTECNGPDDISLTAVPSGGTWTGTGITDPNGTFNAQTAGGVGMYKAYYSYTDGNGCTNQDSITIDVINPTAVTSGNDTTLCVTGDPLDLTGGTPAGGIWIGTGVVNTGGSDYAFYPSIAGVGTHNVIYSLGSGSCEARDTFVATVIDVPSVDAGSDMALCVSEPAFNLTGNSPAGGVWSGTGITDVNAGTFNPAIGSGTYIITYTYTDPLTGCLNSDTRNIVINALPVVSATGAQTECNNPTDLQLTGFSPGGGVWTGAGIVDANLGVFNSVTAGGLSWDGSDTTYQLTYTYTDGNGCIDSASTVITLIFGDTVEAGPNDTVCINDGSLSLTGFSPAGGTWTGNGVAGTTFFPSAAGVGTHTLTYTYGSGSCQKTDTKTVLVLAIPNASAGNDTLVCEGTGTFILVPFSPVGGVWSGNGVTGNVFDPVAAGTGTHILTYTYTDPVTGCQDSDDKRIIVSPLPVVTTTGPVSYCISPDNITLTNYSPAGGIWSGTGIVDNNNGIFNGTTAGGVGTYDVVYTYTDGNGCSNDDTLQISVVDGLTVEAGPRDTVCAYDAAFTLQGFSPIGGTWSGSGITDANAGTFDPGTVAPGTYQLIYTVGTGTCLREDTTFVLIVPTPVVEAGSNIAICADSNAFTLTGFSPAGGTWSGTGITDSINGVFDPQVAGTGTFTLTYTYVEGINGCTNTDTRTITINPLPNISMPDTIIYCNSGGDITISGYTPPGGIWNGQGIVDANLGIFNTITAGGIGDYELTYVYTDANGCIDNDTTILSIVFGDTINAGPDLAMCVTDNPDTLSGYIPTSGGTWTGTGIVNSSLGVFDPSVGAGSYTITYEHGTGTCLKQDTRNIIVGAVPTVEAGINIEYCINDSQDTLTGFSPSNGIWSGNGITDSLNGHFDPATAGTGSHLITYTFTNAITGCENSDTRILTVNGLPNINTGDTATYCDNNNNITLSNYSPVGGTWSGTGIVDAANGIFNTTLAGGIGTYEVFYTVTNGNGCTDMDTLVINVEFGDTVEAGPPIGVCIDNGLLTLSGYTPTSGGFWTGQGIVDGANGIFDPTAVTASTLITLYYTYGTGTCEKTDSTTIFVGEIPQVEAGNNQTVCSADAAFSLSGYVPNSGGVWSGNGITDASNGIFDPSVAGVGTHTLTYTYTNTFTGCSNSDTKLIEVLPAPTVNAGADQTECNSSSNIILSGYSPLGGVWSGSGIIDANGGIFNSIIAGGEGTYTLTYTYTDTIGCTNSDDMIMTVIFGDTVTAGNDMNVCIDNGNVTLVGSPAGGTWSGTGVIDPSGVFDPTVSSTGTHTLTYTFGTGTCQKTDDVDIFVSPAIAVDAGPNLDVCVLNAAFTLTGSSPSTGGSWTGTGIIDGVNGIFDPSTAGVGTHTITYNYLNPVTGCDGSDVRTVTVVAAPTVNAGGTVLYCNNANDIVLSGYSPLGGTWSGPGIVDASNGVFNTIAAGGIGTYELIYSYTSAIGCAAEDTLDVTIIFGDTVEAGPNENTCIDAGFLTLTGFSPAGGTWSGTGIINSNGVFDPATAGTGTHTLTYTYGTGSCQKTDTKTVFVSPAIVVEAGPDLTVCSYDVAFQLTGNSPTNGVWSGTGITDTANGIFDPQVSGVGTFVISFYYINTVTGCEGTDSRVITVATPPTANAGGTAVYCNTTDDITLTGYSPSGGVWSGAGIIDANNGIFNSISAGGLGYNNGDTTYTLTYTYTDGNGCIDTDDLLVTIEFGDTVEAGPDVNICVTGGFLTLTGHSPAGGTWSGTGIIDPSGIFDPSTAGVGSHTLTYTFGVGTCQKTDTRTVIVSADIPVEAGPDLTVCEGSDTILLTGNSPSNGTWSGTGIVNATTGAFDPVTAGVGTHTITYFYSNAVTGCSGTDTRTIEIITPPTVNVGNGIIYCNTNQNQTLSGFSPTGGTWTGPGIVDPSGIFNPAAAGGLAFDGSDTIYYVVYTFGSGTICEATDTLPITITYGDTVYAGVDDTVCIDDGQLVLTGYTPNAGGTWSGTGIVDATNGIFDPSVAGAGIHTLTYTYGTGSCEKSDTKTILVGALPIINPGPDEQVCIDNGAFTLSGFSPQGGTWTGTGITDGNAATFDPSVSGVGTFTLTYTFYSVLGCDSSVTKNVTVSPLPTVTAPDTVEYCDNVNDITLTGYFPTTGGTWSGLGIVDAANGLFNSNIAGGIGLYTLVYSYTDANGCTNTDTTIARVIEGDTVEAGPDEATCIAGGLINMAGFSPFGGTWTGTGIIDAQNGTFDPSIAGTGLHTLTYTYGVGSCQKSDTKTVFVGPIPTVTAGPDETVCQQDAAFTLSNASPAGGTWSGAGVDATGLFTPSSLGAGTYTLTYTYVNAVTGCQNSDQLDITVVAPPAVDAGPAMVMCNTTQNITLSGYTPTGGLWSGPGVIDGINGIFNAQSAGGIGSYKLAYTYTNVNGCFNTDTLEIDVIFGDTVEAGTPDTLCIDNGIFVLSGYSPLTGTWTGTGIVDGNLGTFDPAIAGTGTHVLTYTFGVGTCQKSDTKTIFVDGLPNVAAGPDETICIDNAAFNLTGFTPQGGTWSGAGITDANAGTFDPSVSNTGTFTLTYTYANPLTGCEDSDTKIISVVPLPVVNAGNDVVHCNTPNQITLNPASPSGGVWSGPGIVNSLNGEFSTVIAGGLGYNGADTTYYVSYEYTDNNGCSNTDTVAIDVIFGDTIYAGDNQSVCIDAGLITLTGFTPANGTWSGNGITDPAGVFDPTVAGAGTHTLTYTFGGGTCQKTATKTIVVSNPPTISAGVDETVCIDNGTFLISGYSPLGGFWTGTGVDSSGVFDPSLGTGSYTLTYTFINSVTGCEASDTKVITVAPLPVITASDTVIYCDIPDNITLSGYSPIGGTWSGPGIIDANNGIFNTTQAGGLASNGSDTTYTINYTYIDANGCSNNTDVTISVIFGDTVLAGTNEATCIDAGLLTLQGFTPSGGTWSGLGIIDPIAGVFDPQVAGAGTHTLTYTFGTGTCEKQATKTVTVGTDPLVDAGVDLTMCIDNGQIQFNNFSPLGGIWSGVGITDAANGFFDPAVAGAGSHIITYTFINSVTGCEASDTRVVTVNPLPTVSTPNNIEYCNTGSDIVLTGYSPVGGTWSGTGVVDASGGIFNTNIAGGVGNYTLTYTYTDANGCSNSDTTNINVIFGDTVEAGPNLAVCIADAPFSLTGFSPAGGTWTGDGIINSNGVFDPQVAGLGTHTLTYTFGVGTCQKTDTRTVFVGDIPNVTAGADETVCEQEPAFTLTGFSPSGGTWVGVGITDPLGVFDPGVAGVGTFTLTYTYINTTTGCENTDTKVITVEAPPVVDAGGTITYCNTNNNIILSNYSPVGGVWSGPGVVDALNGVFNTSTAGGEGTYQLVYSYTNPTGCFNSDTLVIDVIFGDTVEAGTPDTICIDNGILTLTGYSPAGGTWSGTGIIDSALGLFDPTISGTGTHTLTYTFGTGTCRKTDTKTVFVDALPIVNAGVDQTVCIDNGAFNLSGFSPQNGTWTGVGITDASLGTFDPSVAGIGTWTLTYTYIKPSTGCEAADTKTIIVAPLPVVSAGNDVVYCNTPNQITLSPGSPVGGTWSGPGIVDAANGGFSTTVAGGLAFDGGDTSYFVVYTYTDAVGCSNNDTLRIDVEFGDTVLAGTNQSICIDAGLLTLTDFQPAGGTWTGPGITDPSGVFDPTAAGLGTHILTYTFGTGTCEKTANKTIFVGAPPTIDAGVDQTVCIDNGQFLLSGYTPLGGFWTGAGVDSSGIFTPSSVGVGTYTLTYTFVNSVTGCEAFDTKVVTVAPLPVVTTTSTIIYCDIPNNITLTGYTPAGGVWTGPGIVDGNAGIFNTTQAGGLAFNGGDTTYTLTYTYTDGNGCVNSNTMDVTVTYGDTVLAGTNEAICIDAGLLTLSGYTPPAGGTWSGNGIIDAVAGVFDPQAAGVGTHVLTYTFGTGTCEKTATKTVTVGDDPIVNAGPDLTHCIDQTTFQLTNFSPLGGTWSGVGIVDAANGFFDPATAGTGTHIITYSFTNAITGCEASDTRTITINPLPVVTVPDTLEFCDNGQNITLSGFSPIGGTWTGTGIVDGTAGIFNSSIAGGQGTYTIDYTYVDANGCENNDTTIISVIFGDTVEAGPDLAVCISDGQFLLSDFQPVGGVWSGNGIIDPSGVFDPQTAGVGLHTVTITFGTGTCLKTDTRDIFVGDIPAVTAGVDQAICGQEADFALTGFSPPGGYWTGVGIVDSSGIFSPTAATPGTWTLTYTYVNDITGCTNSDTKEIFVETPPVVDAGGTITYCNSTNNITLSNYTPTGGVWSGDGIVDGLNGIFNTSVAGGLAYDGGDTTYQVVYEFTSQTGCFGIDTLDIIVTFGDTVVAGVDDTICIDGGQLTLTGYSPAGGTFSGNGIIDPVLGIFDPVVAGAGLHQIGYTFGVGTCEKTDYKTVFVGALPLVDAGNNELICVDQPTYALSNFSPQGGFWQGVGVDSAGNFNPALAGVGTWTLTYTFTNSITGCDNIDTKEITVAPLPQVNVGDTIQYCDNPNDITLSNYSPTGGTWSGTGIVSSNAGIFSTVLAGGIGVYDLTYTFTDNNGCTNRDTLVVDVIFGDTVYAGTHIDMCIDDGILTLSGYTPPSGGTWTGPGITDPSAGTFDPVLAGGGLHVLTYTFGNGTCEKTSTRTVFVGTPPVVDAGPDLTICEDQGAFLLPSFSPAGGTWTGTGVTDPQGIFDPQVTGVGTFTLTYTFINSVTGCENFDTRVVDVVPLPVVNIDDSLEFCINNNNIPLTNYVTTTPSTGIVWSGAGIVDPANGIFNATIAGGIGSYDIVISFTDGNSCTNRDTMRIDVIFGDTVEAGPNDTLCINDNPVLLTGFSPIGGTWTGAGVDQASGTFDPATAGVGTHVLTYTFGTGTCQKTDTRIFVVGALPSINIGPDQTLCIDALAIVLSGYSPQGGTWSGVGITDPNIGIFDAQVAGIGTHILTYTFANSITGCENTAQRTITVAPLPVVDAGDTILICDNPNDYTLTNYFPSGGTWSGQGVVNASAGVINTVIAGGLAQNNGDTTYHFVYTFTDGNSCTNQDTLVVDVEFGDSIEAGPNEAICIDIGLYQLTGFLPTMNGVWSGNGIVDPINGIFDPQAAGPGAHTLTISTGTGTCAKTDTKIIFVGTPPAVNPGNDQAVCEDATAFTFTGFSPPGGVWAGTGITDTINGVFDPQVSGVGTFVLSYTFVNSVTNCQTTATKTVTVNPLPFVDAGDTVTYCDNPNDIVLSGYTPASGGFWSGPGIVNPSQGVFNTVTAGGIGVYHLAYDYTDPFTGCVNNDTLVVDVIFGDTVVAGLNDTVCIQDLPFTLGGSPAGGTWSGTGVTNGNLGIFNPAVAGGGTHILTYTYGTGTCEKTDQKIVFVGEPDPLYAGPDQIVCFDALPITLTASLQDGVWSGNGIVDQVGGVFIASNAQVGIHDIVYTYQNPVTGCVSRDTLVIEVKPLPVINTAGTITYCDYPFDVQLPAATPTPGVWTGAGIVNQNAGLFNSQVAGGLGYNGGDTSHIINYTHTDAFGCSNSGALIVNVTYGDSVLAGPDRTVCITDAPITLNGFSPLGGYWTGVGITDSSGIFDPSTVSAGTYNIVYTQGLETCVKSDTIAITVIDVTNTTAGNDQEFCFEDGLVNLTGQFPLGGVWTGPGIQDGNAGTFLTQAVSTGITSDTVQICYTYTEPASGCFYTDCKNVIINPLPTVGFTAVDTACVNDVIQFSNASVDAVSFKWFFGDGDSSIFLSPTHTYDTSGLYTVTLIAFSDKGCPDTITQDILIYEIPVANFAMSTNDGCGPLLVSFTNLSTAQDQDLSYSWDFGNGIVSAQQNPPAQSYNAGVEDTVYVVTLTVSNQCGTTTFIDSIIVRPMPNVFFAADDNYGCGPLTVNFSNASTGGPNSYLWNFGPFGTSTDTVPPPVVFTISDTIPVTYWVTLTATNACGTDIDSIPITVIPGMVNAGIGTDVTAGCQPLTVNFTSAVQAGDNVQWIFGDGNGSVLNNPTHTFDTVGTFTVLQIVTNQCGADTATVNIDVYPQPPMSFSHDPFVCVGDAIQFTNSSTPIAGTVWHFGDGDSSTLTNPTHVYQDTGLYTVYITNYSITHLCPITDSTVVEVKNIPHASFTPDNTNGCAPLTINFANNSTGLFNAWQFSDGNVTILSNPTHTFDTAGQYFVTLTTTDQFGCSHDTTWTGIVAHPKPIADFIPSTDAQCGLDAVVTLTNTSQAADAYFWDFQNGTFSNVVSPTISYNTVGDHTIELQASNTFGCRDTIQKTITTYPAPNADFDLQPQQGCEPLTVQFIQLATNTNGYEWRFGDGTTSTQANPLHTYSQGSYNVTFIANIDEICYDSITIVDAVFAEGSPVADFEVLELDPDDPTGVLLFNNLSQGATSYEWEFGDGTFSNEESPSKEYLENGQRIVRLIVWNDQGCSDTMVQVIEPVLFKGLFVPNAFSPDAGIGDVRVFRPVGVGIEEYRVQVFAQWGELLWESSALDDAGRPTEGWDGMYNGTPMPQGAYVWKVHAIFKDGSAWEGQENTLGQTKKIGSVTLLR